MLAGSLDLVEFNICHDLAIVHWQISLETKGLGSPLSLSLSLSLSPHTHTHLHAKTQTRTTKDLTTYHQHLSILDLL